MTAEWGWTDLSDDIQALHAEDLGRTLEGAERHWWRLTPEQREHTAASLRKRVEYRAEHEPYEANASRVDAKIDPDGDRAWDDTVSEPDLGRIVLRRASDIKMKRTKWLWRDHIPLGEITVLAGREDLGKSTVALTWAAQVTNGTLPGEYYGEPRDVLICAVEDSWAETVVPRLTAAGADTKRVHEIALIDGGGPDLTDDLDNIRAAVEYTNAALIIFDPLTSRLGERVEQNKGPEVRRVLEPVKKLAQDAGISVLCIMHVNKSTGSDANSSIMGSSEFKNIPRCIMIATKDGEDDAKRYVGVSKLNIGLKPRAQEYSTTGVKVEDGIWSSKIMWGSESAHSIDDLWSESQSIEGGTLTAQDEAMEWLLAYLAAGEKESSLVKAAGQDAGHKPRTLARARPKAGVIVRQDGRETFWSLPVPTDVTSTSAGTGGTGHEFLQDPSTHTHANTYLPSQREPVPPVPSLRGTGTGANNEPFIITAPERART